MASRTAVRSLSSLPHAVARTSNTSALARTGLTLAARSPASFASRRSLCSNPRQLQQFPRLQSVQSFSNKRSFSSTVTMVWLSTLRGTPTRIQLDLQSGGADTCIIGFGIPHRKRRLWRNPGTTVRSSPKQLDTRSNWNDSRFPPISTGVRRLSGKILANGYTK